MTLTEVIQAFQKIAPLVGDAEVVLADVESGAKSVIHSLSIDLSPSGEAASTVVTVKHGPEAAPEPAPEPEPESAPADPPAA